MGHGVVQACMARHMGALQPCGRCEVVTLILLLLILLFVSSKIFNHELFGEVAEEKEVKGIISKVMEARRSKSYDSYEILATYVGKDQVTKLILPLKEVRK